MNTFPGLFSLSSISALVLTTQLALADTASPAMAAYHPLVGHWQGDGQLGEAGQKPMAMNLQLNCREASAGAAVSCEMQARNGEMLAAETDLFGVNPVTGEGHWYAVTNQGEVHDHVVVWQDAHTMNASTRWKQEGVDMEERIVMQFPSDRSLAFHSVVTAGGKLAAEFSGNLKR